jgi:hypothetical protein
VAVGARAYVGIGGGLLEDAGGLIGDAGGMIGEMQWRGIRGERRGERREDRREERREESLAHPGGMTRERQAAEILATALLHTHTLHPWHACSILGIYVLLQLLV